jgi:hypothetical protein
MRSELIPFDDHGTLTLHRVDEEQQAKAVAKVKLPDFGTYMDVVLYVSELEQRREIYVRLMQYLQPYVDVDVAAAREMLVSRGKVSAIVQRNTVTKVYKEIETEVQRMTTELLAFEAPLKKAKK